MRMTEYLSGLRQSLVAVGAVALAGVVPAPAAHAADMDQPVVHVAAASASQADTLTDAVAPPPPMFLEPPFERVPAEGKAIFVNVPSFELIAFDDGREVMRSRVIVGSPKNPTPNLMAHTSVVRFRPTWTPTPTMIREEGISPETRPPGRNNPLGLLAIRMDPGMLIYLHDTNNRKLFDREKRALSHGCVRVEKWDEVAAFVLGIPVEEVHKHAEGNRTFDMDTQGVPVIVSYNTSFPDATGVTRKYADVYGREARYAQTLKPKPAKKRSFDWDSLPTSWSAN